MFLRRKKLYLFFYIWWLKMRSGPELVSLAAGSFYFAWDNWAAGGRAGCPGRWWGGQPGGRGYQRGGSAAASPGHVYGWRSPRPGRHDRGGADCLRHANVHGRLTGRSLTGSCGTGTSCKYVPLTLCQFRQFKLRDAPDRHRYMY